jgi:hypothetical protein
MKNLFRLLVVVLLLGGWLLAAMSLHVIYTGGGITVIPKNRLSFTDTYVDPRGWTIDDAAAHPSLVKRLIETGKAERVLSHVVDTESSKDLSSQLREAIERGPAPPSPKLEKESSTQSITASIKQLKDVVSF